MRVRLLPVCGLLLAAPALAGCGLLDGGNDLDDALELVPAGAEAVTFVGRASIAERLGVDDVEAGADEEDLSRYAAAIGDAGAPTTSLGAYLREPDDILFSELDVEWSVAGLVDDARFEVFRLHDDVDLDEVGDRLAEAGYGEGELAGRRHFTDPPLDVVSQAVVAEVALDPDEHLAVTGPGAADVLETLDDDADSVVDAGTFDGLLDDTDDVEYVQLGADPECGRGPRVPEGADLPDLAQPRATAYLMSGGDEVTHTARLAFESDDAAEQDAEARAAYLDDGVLILTGQPVSDLLEAEVEADGEVVTVDLDLEEDRTGRQVAEAGDGFLLCTEGAGE